MLLPGSIVPWIPQDNSPPPAKWVVCDGSKITTGPWRGQKTPDMRGHFLLGASREEVIVKANQEEGEAEFNRNNPDAMALKGELEADSEEGYCFIKTPYSKSVAESCSKTRFKTSFEINPQDIENALDAYKVVYIMKVE